MDSILKAPHGLTVALPPPSKQQQQTSRVTSQVLRSLPLSTSAGPHQMNFRCPEQHNSTAVQGCHSSKQAGAGASCHYQERSLEQAPRQPKGRGYCCPLSELLPERPELALQASLNPPDPPKPPFDTQKDTQNRGMDELGDSSGGCGPVSPRPTPPPQWILRTEGTWKSLATAQGGGPHWCTGAAGVGKKRGSLSWNCWVARSHGSRPNV